MSARSGGADGSLMAIRWGTVRIAASALLSALALVVAACGGGGKGVGSVVLTPLEGGSPTPTVSPSSTPTATPSPTGVPSASPLAGPIVADTWSTIGAFQPFDGGITKQQATAHAPRYVLTWGTDKPSDWIDGNSAINATYYIAFDTDADVGAFGNLGHDLAWWQQNPHADWVLYKCDRRTPAYVGGLPSNVPFDISNPAVVAYQMSIVGPYMAANGYTSLAADVLSIDNGQAGCGVWTHHHTVWVQRFSGQRVDPKWAAAAQYWAAYAQWYMHGMPVPTPFVANAGLGGIAQGDPGYEQLISHLDGFQDEAGFTSFGNHLIGDADFRTKIWWAQYVQAQGKAFMVADLWQHHEPSSTQRDFAIATYLMGRYHQEAMMTAEYGSYGVEHYWSEYDSAVGSPCSDMYSDQGVYLRKNTGSLVIVNVAKTDEWVTLPHAASSYTDMEGRRVTDPLHVGQDDGWVLLTNNGCS